jgi:signal transduction histidine kinase
MDRGFEFTLDRAWRITSITESAAAWAGSTVDDLVGRDGHDINLAATRQLAEPIEAAFARGATSCLEQPSTHVPGRRVRVEVSPCENGARICFEDVTSEVSADDVDSSGEGPAEIVLLDRRGVIVSANAAWRAGVLALGLELANFGVGAHYAELAKAAVPTTDKVGFQERLEALFSGQVSQFEATYSLDTPGGQRPRQVRISPLRIGETTYFLAIHEDLTERAKVLAALHETSDQLLHAQEQERQRIAIELHDSTSQHLAGMVLGLHQLRREVGQNAAAQKRIDEIGRLTQQTIRETQVLSYLMNASGREREGLETSVRRFVEGFGRRAGLSATFETEGPVDAISAAAQHAVFRVVQEALTNVYRHAGASNASVSLLSREGILTVRISDDGRGMGRMAGDEDEPPLGVGIPGMRARIEQLGGRLEIAGAATGATVTASLPLG